MLITELCGKFVALYLPALRLRSHQRLTFMKTSFEILLIQNRHSEPPITFVLLQNFLCIEVLEEVREITDVVLFH